MNLEEIGFIIILGVVVAFYLMLVRPAQQEQKRHQQTIRDLKPGDEVVTTSNFIARIKEIHTPEAGPIEVVLDLGDGIEVRALTNAILRKTKSAVEAAAPQEEAKGA